MPTHAAVVTLAPRAPLELHQVPTPIPGSGEVFVRNEWTASTPLDLYQNDGHLLVTPPQILGDGIAGTVIQLGNGTKRLKAGDKVFGFAHEGNKQKAHQEYVCVPEHVLGVIPEGFSMQEAVTLPNNFVTVFHALTTDLGLELPWPKGENWVPKDKDLRILIWGGSSSVGQFALQVLRWYGFAEVTATASKRNFKLVEEAGAKDVFDYINEKVIEKILEAGKVDLVLDCIGSQSGSLTPIAKIADKGSIVAILLPVIVRDASASEAPIYAMDVEKAVKWKDGVVVKGVRTHFWQENAFFKESMQTVFMPEMLRLGIVKPNRQRVVEGKGLLERAETATGLLRGKEVSGERAIWRVWESEEK